MRSPYELREAADEEMHRAAVGTDSADEAPYLTRAEMLRCTADIVEALLLVFRAIGGTEE